MLFADELPQGHAIKFILIDEKGNIRKYFDGTDDGIEVPKNPLTTFPFLISWIASSIVFSLISSAIIIPLPTCLKLGTKVTKGAPSLFDQVN